VRNGVWREVLIAEELNPLTGAAAGRHRAKRQLLRLLAGHDVDRGAAESVFDPVTGTWIVRVNWRREDALRFDYSFTTFCPGPPPTAVENVSIFYGNLVTVHEGRPLEVHFYEPGTLLPTESATARHRHFERLNRYGDGRDWVLAPLPDEGPLAYLPPSGGARTTGEEPARSTVFLQVEPPGAARETWDEVESLVHSDDSAAHGASPRQRHQRPPVAGWRDRARRVPDWRRSPWQCWRRSAPQHAAAHRRVERCDRRGDEPLRRDRRP
jgi:hypothetical protein